MKRAKIALTAVGMFAIIGGALAFKAHRGIDTFCRLTSQGTGACTITYFNTSTIATTALSNLYCTTVPGAACTQKKVLSFGG